MNIHFSELDNNQTEIKSPEKYWENYQQPNQQQSQTKKKKVSFDDILTNMNIVVNESGVLQFMQPIQPTFDNNDEYQQPYQQPYQQYVSQQLAKKQQQQQQQSIDPQVKHSFIYNKYFKDYKDSCNYQPEVRVPKTFEEYKQMLIEDKIKRIEQKKRISQIKSTKLIFTTNVGNQNVIQPTKNNLRNMNFH
jgi:hypothetical protein